MGVKQIHAGVLLYNPARQSDSAARSHGVIKPDKNTRDIQIPQDVWRQLFF
jgi:hypothetical protein